MATVMFVRLGLSPMNGFPLMVVRLAGKVISLMTKLWIADWINDFQTFVEDDCRKLIAIYEGIFFNFCYLAA